MSNVVAYRQSPMNAQRWCLDLDCGHETWMTAKRRPTTKSVDCEKCRAIDSSAHDKAVKKVTRKER